LHKLVLGKFKEKNPKILAEANAAMDFFLKSMSFEDMVDGLVANLAEKTPGTKV
jgi:hypothetical protein